MAKKHKKHKIKTTIFMDPPLWRPVKEPQPAWEASADDAKVIDFPAALRSSKARKGLCKVLELMKGLPVPSRLIRKRL